MPKSTNLPAPAQFQIDLFRDSLDHFLAVAFPKSTAAGYAAAVTIARQADKYGETDIGGKHFNFAAFGRTPEEAARASAVMRYLYGLSGVQYYAKGKILRNLSDVTMVLDCYLESTTCNDSRAHCNKVVSDIFGNPSESIGIKISIGVEDLLPKKKTVHEYLFPCMYLLRWNKAELSEKHPASVVDQIQALGVKRGCDWCPNFKPEDFKKLQDSA